MMGVLFGLLKGCVRQARQQRNKMIIKIISGLHFIMVGEKVLAYTAVTYTF